MGAPIDQWDWTEESLSLSGACRSPSWPDTNLDQIAGLTKLRPLGAGPQLSAVHLPVYQQPCSCAAPAHTRAVAATSAAVKALRVGLEAALPVSWNEWRRLCIKLHDMEPEELPAGFISSYTALLGRMSGGQLMPASIACRRGCVIIVLDLLDLDPFRAARPLPQAARGAVQWPPQPPLQQQRANDAGSGQTAGAGARVLAPLPPALEALLAALPTPPHPGSRVTVHQVDGGGRDGGSASDGSSGGGSTARVGSGGADGGTGGDDGWAAGTRVLLEYTGPAEGWRVLQEPPPAPTPPLQQEYQQRQQQPGEPQQRPSPLGSSPAQGERPPASSSQLTGHTPTLAPVATQTPACTSERPPTPRAFPNGQAHQRPEPEPIQARNGRPPRVPPLALDAAGPSAAGSSGAPSPCDVRYSVSASGDADPRSTSDGRSVSLGAVCGLAAGGGGGSQTASTPLWRPRSAALASWGAPPPASRPASLALPPSSGEGLDGGRGGGSSVSSFVPGQGQRHSGAGSGSGAGALGSRVMEAALCGARAAEAAGGGRMILEEDGEVRSGGGSRADRALSALTRRLSRRPRRQSGSRLAPHAGGVAHATNACSSGGGGQGHQFLPLAALAAGAAAAAPVAAAPLGAAGSVRRASGADHPVKKLVRRLRARQHDPVAAAASATAAVPAAVLAPGTASPISTAPAGAAAAPYEKVAKAVKPCRRSRLPHQPQPSVARPLPGELLNSGGAAGDPFAVGAGAAAGDDGEALEEALRSLLDEYAVTEAVCSAGGGGARRGSEEVRCRIPAAAAVAAMAAAAAPDPAAGPATAPADFAGARLLSRELGWMLAPGGSAGAGGGGLTAAGLLLTSDGATTLTQSLALMSISQPSTPLSQPRHALSHTRAARLPPAADFDSDSDADTDGAGGAASDGDARAQGEPLPHGYVSGSNLLRRAWMQRQAGHGSRSMRRLPRSSAVTGRRPSAVAYRSIGASQDDALWSAVQTQTQTFSGSGPDGSNRGGGGGGAAELSYSELWELGLAGAAAAREPAWQGQRDGHGDDCALGASGEWSALNSSLLMRVSSETVRRAAWAAAAAATATAAEGQEAGQGRSHSAAAAAAAAAAEVTEAEPEQGPLPPAAAHGGCGVGAHPPTTPPWPPHTPVDEATAGHAADGETGAPGGLGPSAPAGAVAPGPLSAGGVVDAAATGSVGGGASGVPGRQAAAPAPPPVLGDGRSGPDPLPIASGEAPLRSYVTPPLFTTMPALQPDSASAGAAAAVAAAGDAAAAGGSLRPPEMPSSGALHPAWQWHVSEAAAAAAPVPVVQPVAVAAPPSAAASVRLAVWGLPPAWAARPAAAAPVAPALAVPGAPKADTAAATATLARLLSAGLSVASWGSGVPAVAATDEGASVPRPPMPPPASEVAAVVPSAAEAEGVAVDAAGAEVTEAAETEAGAGAGAGAAGADLEVAVRSAGRYLPVRWWWRLPQCGSRVGAVGGGAGCSAEGPVVLELSVSGVPRQGLLMVEIWHRGVYGASMPVVCSDNPRLVAELSLESRPLLSPPPVPPPIDLTPAAALAAQPHGATSQPGAVGAIASAATDAAATAGLTPRPVPDGVLYDLGMWLQYTAAVVPPAGGTAELALQSLETAAPQPLSPFASAASAARTARTASGAADQQPAALPPPLPPPPPPLPLLRLHTLPPALQLRPHTALASTQSSLLPTGRDEGHAAAAGGAYHHPAAAAAAETVSPARPGATPPQGASDHHAGRGSSGLLGMVPQPSETVLAPTHGRRDRRGSLFSAATDRALASALAASATGGAAGHAAVARTSSVPVGLHPAAASATQSGEGEAGAAGGRTMSGGELTTALFSSHALPAVGPNGTVSGSSIVTGGGEGGGGGGGGRALLSAFSAAAAGFVGVVAAGADAPAGSNESEFTGVGTLMPPPPLDPVAAAAATTHGSAAAVAAARPPGNAAAAPAVATAPPSGGGSGAAGAAARRRLFHDSAVDITVPIAPGSLDLASAVTAMQRGPAFGQCMQDMAVGLLAWLVRAGLPATAGEVLRGLLRQRGMSYEAVCAEVRRLGRGGGAAGGGGDWGGMGLLHLAVHSGCVAMVQAVAGWAATLGSVLDWAEGAAESGLTPLHLAAALVAPDGADHEDEVEGEGDGVGGAFGNDEVARATDPGGGSGGGGAAAAAAAPPGLRQPLEPGLNEAGLEALVWLLRSFPETRAMWGTRADAFGSTPADLLGYHLARVAPAAADRARGALVPLLGNEWLGPPPLASAAAPAAPAARFGGAASGGAAVAVPLRRAGIVARGLRAGVLGGGGRAGGGGALRRLRAAWGRLCLRLEAWALEPVGALALLALLAVFWVLNLRATYAGDAGAWSGADDGGRAGR